MRVERALLLASLLLAPQTAPTEPPPWTDLTWGAFRVAGTAEASRLALVARQASELWRASQSLVPDVKAPGTSPMVILAAADPALEASTFLEGRGRSYAVVPPQSDHLPSDVAAAIVRQFVQNASASVPLWVEVGLGEYLSTLEVTPDGTQITLGKPVAAHLTALRGGLLQMPLILRATPESPVYTDASQRRRFVAQSWLLVHYLCATDQRRPQIGTFVQMLARQTQTPPETTVRMVFGMDPETIGHALTDYVAQGHFLSYEPAADRSKGPTDTRQLTRTESNALVADALVQAGKVREALARLQSVSATDPHLHDAQMISARALAQRGDRPRALRLFAEAIEQADFTDLREYYYADALLNVGSLGSLDVTHVSADDARLAGQLLTTFLARAPEHGDALALLGVAQLAMQNAGGAMQRLTEAFHACPRHEYALWLARARAAGGDVTGARQLLEPLAERGRPRAVRVASQQLLASLPASDAPARQTFPLLREPKPGELKASGVLTDIACSADGVVFHVTLADRELRVATARLDLVDFISYRPDAAVNPRCGRRAPGDQVSIIWHPDRSAPAGTEGFVSAVEFPASPD